MLPPLLHCAEKPWDDEACVGFAERYQHDLSESPGQLKRKLNREGRTNARALQ